MATSCVTWISTASPRNQSAPLATLDALQPRSRTCWLTTPNQQAFVLLGDFAAWGRWMFFFCLVICLYLFLIVCFVAPFLCSTCLAVLSYFDFCWWFVVCVYSCLCVFVFVASFFFCDESRITGRITTSTQKLSGYP